MLDKNTDEYKIECYAQALQSIIDIGFDYDGCSKVESLKELIDELVKMARDGLDLKLPQYVRNESVISIYKGSSFQIPEDEWNEDVLKWRIIQKAIEEARNERLYKG